MNVSPVGGSVQAGAIQAQVRGTVFRVGQEMSATILSLGDDRATLELEGGGQLSAQVQTEQPLSPGDTLLFRVVGLNPGEVTLQVMARPEAAAASSPGQILSSYGLADNQLAQSAVSALIAEKLPISSDAVTGLVQAAEDLDLEQPDAVRGIAFLAARGLPATPELVAVAQQGLAGHGVIQAGKALSLAAREALPGLESGTGDRSLKSLVLMLADDEPVLPAPHQIVSLLTELGRGVEAMFAKAVVHSDEGESGPGQRTQPSPGNASDPAQRESSDPAVTQSRSGTTSVGEEVPPRATQPVPDTHNPAGTGNLPSRGSTSATGGVASDELLRQGVISDFVTTPIEHPVASPSAGQTVDGGRLAQMTLESVTAPDRLPAGDLPGVPTLARQLVATIDAAVSRGAIDPVSVSHLRDRALDVVRATQFQHLQMLPSDASRGGHFISLTVPPAHGLKAHGNDIQVFLRDKNGRAAIDPNDLTIVIHLSLSYLNELTITLHLARRHIQCRVETDSAGTEMLLRSASPELRRRIEGLGFTVSPIQLQRRSEHPTSTFDESESPLGQVNLRV